MDRRTFLHGSLGAAVAVAAADAAAQSASSASPSQGRPVDARSVWLTGDSAPHDAVAMAALLASLAPGKDEPRDRYLEEGAVAALEHAFAKLLGKEDCAFFATGTLANNVAVRVLCGGHPRALVQQESHLYRDEVDSAQRLSGINLVPLAPERAIPTLGEVRAAIDASENGPYPMKIGAVSLETPVRRANGDMVPLVAVRGIAKLAREHGARLHLDGARLLLAPPAFDRAAYVTDVSTPFTSA